MIGWILFAITAVVAVAALAALKRKSDAEVRQLEEAQRASVRKLETESQKRVDRLQREADTQQSRARDALARDLFAAVDSLHAALQGAEDPEVRRGIQLVLDDVYAAFARHDIEPIDPGQGDAFDPNRHEAIDVLDGADVGPGEVARCHRQGFTNGTRVLRPALVSVGSRAAVEVPEDEAEQEPAHADSVS
jgi:molecular chaperone GrpE